MNTSRVLRGLKPWLIFAVMPALLLWSDLGDAQATMPHMREMASMEDHHSHSQQRQTTAKLSTDDSTQRFTFTSIDVPSAAGTLAAGINARDISPGFIATTRAQEIVRR